MKGSTVIVLAVIAWYLLSNRCKEGDIVQGPSGNWLQCQNGQMVEVWPSGGMY